MWNFNFLASLCSCGDRFETPKTGFLATWSNLRPVKINTILFSMPRVISKQTPYPFVPWEDNFFNRNLIFFALDPCLLICSLISSSTSLDFLKTSKRSFVISSSSQRRSIWSSIGFSSTGLRFADAEMNTRNGLLHQNKTDVLPVLIWNQRVRCGAWLYWFLIFAAFLTLTLLLLTCGMATFVSFANCFYWPFPGSTSFVDHLCYLCLVFVMLSCLFIAALWSPPGKGVTQDTTWESDKNKAKRLVLSQQVTTRQQWTDAKAWLSYSFKGLKIYEKSWFKW